MGCMVEQSSRMERHMVTSSVFVHGRGGGALALLGIVKHSGVIVTKRCGLTVLFRGHAGVGCVHPWGRLNVESLAFGDAPSVLGCGRVAPPRFAYHSCRPVQSLAWGRGSSSSSVAWSAIS